MFRFLVQFMGVYMAAVQRVFETFFPALYGENCLMSPEIRKILAHPEDRKKYLAMHDKFREGSREETIELHTGEVLKIKCYSVKIL